MSKRILAIAFSILLMTAPCWSSSIELRDDGTVVGLANAIDFIGSTTTVSNSVGTVTLNDIDSGTIDGAVIGGTTPAAGTFTTLTANTSITLNGSTITDWGGVVSPWTDGGATTTLNSAPTKFIATHATGVFAVTGLKADTADIVLENDQIIDGGTNGSILFTEAGDTMSIAFSGTDIVLDTTDGGYIFLLTDTTDGSVDIRANNDPDDYISFTTVANVPTIVTAGGSNLAIIPDGGTTVITGDLTVSGTGTITTFATTSILMGDDTLSLSADDVLRWESNDEKATILVYGFESKSAVLAIHADEGDNAGDEWALTVADGGTLAISNDSASIDTQANIAVFSNSGDFTMEGDVITFGDDEFISNAIDGTVLVSTNDENMIFIVKSANSGNGTADLILAGDAIGDAGDQWRFRAGGVAEDLLIGNDSAVSGTFVTKLEIASATGNVDITGDLDITGGDITVPADLTITPAGADVLVDGGLTVGSTTQAGDNNLRVEGTSALVGDATVTGDAIVTGADITLGATGVKISSDNDGAITYLGLSGGFDETYTVNLDDVDNEATVTSAGITLWNFDGAIDLKVSGLDFTLGDAGVIFTADTDGSLTIAGLGNGSDENLIYDFDNTADTVEITTSTGVATILHTDIGITMTEGTDASQPLLWMENTKDDATSPIIRLENDRTTETDGDDLGIIYFRGSDDAEGASDFITILAEANEVSAGEEAGKLSFGIKINDGSVDFFRMYGDTGGGDTGHIEFNSGTIDLDTHIDSNDQADIFLLDALTNDITLTRNLAATGTNDGPILVVTNTSATGDVGVASFLNAAAASATEPCVKILSSAAGVVKSSLFVDHDGTAGDTTEAAVVIDSEDVQAAALYITSAVDATGTTAQIDDYALTVVVEGVGGGQSIYRNVAGTTALLKLEEVHINSTSELLTIVTAADDTSNNDVVSIQASASAFNDRALFVNHDGTAGATKVPAVEIDAELTTSASLIIRGAQTIAGTDTREDEAVLSVVAEGVGGIAYFHRNVATTTKAGVTIEEQSATGTEKALYVLTAQNATAATPVVKFETTSSAHDQAVLEIVQVGEIALLISDGGVVYSVEDLTTSADDPGVATATLTTVVTTVTTDNTGSVADAVDIADGTKGQIKIFTLKADTETTGLKIIPDNLAGGVTFILFEDVGDSCTMVFDGTNWVIVSNNGGTIG